MAAALSPTPMIASNYPDPGYRPQACSFDLDDDGIRGEPYDDCRLCNGVTADPDGDSIAEDLIYVDTDNGSDTTGTGTPAKPYGTIQFAWQMADGPADGAEDIICFRGVASASNGLEDDMTPWFSGLEGAKVRGQSGSEVRDFEYPSNPTMLVGWDFDNDKCYPPYDNGVTNPTQCGTEPDVAVLDGSGLKRAFRLKDKTFISYLEMAHFEARNFGYQTAATGKTGANGIGFFSFGSAGVGASTHIYIHDLLLRNINRAKGKESFAVFFNVFVGGLRLQHVAIENLKVLNTGGYFFRGGFGENADGDSGPIRFKNISYTALGCDYGVPPCGNDASLSTVTGFKPWGMVDGLELLDSDFDANTENWNPRRTGPVNAFVANICTRNWFVRNNRFRNWKLTFAVKGSESYCGLRPTDEVVIDANEVINDDDQYDYGAIGVSVGTGGGQDPNSTVEDVTIINNIFRSEIGFRRCVRIQSGNDTQPATGKVVFVGNTCHGRSGFSTDAHIEVTNLDEIAFPTENIVIQNNVVSGLRAGEEDLALRIDYLPSALELDFNTYTPHGEFQDWTGAQFSSLADWRAASGFDLSSRSCGPRYRDLPNGDLHLRSDDLCAKDRGSDLGAIGLESKDHDGDDRPEGPARDVGADEYRESVLIDGFETGDSSAWQ